jgi:hypothetical protein
MTVNDTKGDHRPKSRVAQDDDPRTWRRDPKRWIGSRENGFSLQRKADLAILPMWKYVPGRRKLTDGLLEEFKCGKLRMMDRKNSMHIRDLRDRKPIGYLYPGIRHITNARREYESTGEWRDPHPTNTHFYDDSIGDELNFTLNRLDIDEKNEWMEIHGTFADPRPFTPGPPDIVHFLIPDEVIAQHPYTVMRRTIELKKAARRAFLMSAQFATHSFHSHVKRVFHYLKNERFLARELDRLVLLYLFGSLVCKHCDLVLKNV